jgi:hypothetical protein
MTWTRRASALLILAALAVTPALSLRADRAAAATEAADGRSIVDSRVASTNGRTGIGVELEVHALRIELAWFESVPISPGRRLVFSWLADPARGE